MKDLNDNQTLDMFNENKDQDMIHKFKVAELLAMYEELIEEYDERLKYREGSIAYNVISDPIKQLKSQIKALCNAL